MYTRRDPFQAIADPVRREIIDIVATAPMTINDLAANFDISRPAVSKHIRILEECEMITIETRGRERYCRTRMDTLREVAAWTDKYRHFWKNSLDNLQKLLEEDDSKD